MRKLQGAYVQAWVWVDAKPREDARDDDYFRKRARRLWHRDGEIEVDEVAKVSRSYEGG